MNSPETLFPALIETPRLVLRTWAPSESVEMKALIDANLAHLQAWMAWAVNEPSPLDAIVARIAGFAAEFASGESAVYAIRRRDDGRAIGGAGVERRDGDAVEIGYWLDQSCTGQGFVTEAAHALTVMSLALPGITRAEIRCDPGHTASAAVARRLGYTHRETIPHDTVKPDGTPRDTMVWQVTAPPEQR